MSAAAPVRQYLAFAASMLGCEGELSRVEGDHVVYEYSKDAVPCAGNVPYLDRLIPFLSAQSGFPIPDQVRFSWIIEDWEALGIPVGSHLTTGSHAWATFPVETHELTHAITGGMPARFFTEGIARALELGSGPEVANRYAFESDDLQDPVWDPWATLTASRSDDVNYATAAVFVLFLLVRHGPERFHAFYRGLGGPATRGWLRSQFRAAYGVELDDEIAEFRAGIPTCGPASHPVLLPDCSQPRVAWKDERLWEHRVSMGCDEPSVVGGIGPDQVWPSFSGVTLEVPEGGYHVVSFDNREAATVKFGACFGCPWELRDIYLEGFMSQRTLILEPGIYYVRIDAQSDEAPEVTVKVQRP